jgi:Arc/MetJ family transcription regulator
VRPGDRLDIQRFPVRRVICRYAIPTLTSIRLNTKLADQAAKALGAKSRTEAVHLALEEIVALNSFKNLMRENRGKLSFDGCDE